MYVKVDWWMVNWKGGLEGGGPSRRQVESRLLGEGPPKYGDTDRKSEDLSLTWDFDLT